MERIEVVDQDQDLIVNGSIVTSKLRVLFPLAIEITYHLRSACHIGGFGGDQIFAHVLHVT